MRRSRRWVLGATPFAAVLAPDIGAVLAGPVSGSAADPVALAADLRQKAGSALIGQARAFDLTLNADSVLVGASNYNTVVWAAVVGYETLTEADLAGGRVVALAYLGLRPGVIGPPVGTYAIRVNSVDGTVQFLNSRGAVAHQDGVSITAGNAPPRLDMELQFDDIDLRLFNPNIEIAIDFDFD